MKDSIEKKDFLELYNNAKKGNIDLLSLPPETLKKMCTLLEEEIKMKERDIQIIQAKLNAL